jgi:hypothetical protein
MGFFDDLGSGLGSVLNWSTGAIGTVVETGVGVINKAGAPIMQGLVKPAYENVVKPGVNIIADPIKSAVNRVADWGDNIFSLPVLIMGGLVIAIVLPTILNKK